MPHVAAHHRPLHDLLTTGMTRVDSVVASERLDVAVRAVVHGTNVTVLAERTGIPRATLYRYASLADNASREHVRLPAADVPRLTAATGNDGIIEHLARECGGVFVRIPRPLDGAGDLLMHAAAITAEFSAVQGATATALADAAITAAERAALDAELEDLVQRASALRIALREPARKPGAKVTR